MLAAAPPQGEVMMPRLRFDHFDPPENMSVLFSLVRARWLPASANKPLQYSLELVQGPDTLSLSVCGPSLIILIRSVDMAKNTGHYH